MSTERFAFHAPFAAFVASLVALLASGCLFVVEPPPDRVEVHETVIYTEVDEEDLPEPSEEEAAPPLNHSPWIVPGASFWGCEVEGSDAQFVFETEVEDPDGLLDIAWVEVVVWRAGTDWFIDSFFLFDEGYGFYGANVWESQSYLYCGEPIDVVFEVRDQAGALDAVTLWY